MHRDVDRADELRHAVRFYERAVQRRRALTARTAALSLHGLSRRPRWSERVRPAVGAGLVLVVSVAVAVAVVSPRGGASLSSTCTRTLRSLKSNSNLVSCGSSWTPATGGHDPGARADELKEAALVLDVATRLEERRLESRSC